MSRTGTILATCLAAAIISLTAFTGTRLYAQTIAHSSREPQSCAVIVCGVTGDQAHFDRFWKLTIQTRQLLTERLGFKPEDVRILFEEKDPDSSIVSARSTKADILAVLEDTGKALRPDDLFFLFIFGHAGTDGHDVRLHLPGPDMSPEELTDAVNKLPPSRQVIILGTPVSGYFMMPMLRKDRVVISATRPTAEMSETVFPYCFVESFLDKRADANSDGLVSIAEVFNCATKRVKEFYDERELIQTEHARLNDTGEGGGSEYVDDKMPDGRAAEKLTFRRITPM
ncbi:MAG TPA: hypothetical protein PL033_01100 [Candidatus Brocadiia bacterium]|nr:hypothetical protein [Candidatus Brocadiia bacterium]